MEKLSLVVIFLGVIAICSSLKLSQKIRHSRRLGSSADLSHVRMNPRTNERTNVRKASRSIGGATLRNIKNRLQIQNLPKNVGKINVIKQNVIIDAGGKPLKEIKELLKNKMARGSENGQSKGNYKSVRASSSQYGSPIGHSSVAHSVPGLGALDNTGGHGFDGHPRTFHTGNVGFSHQWPAGNYAGPRDNVSSKRSSNSHGPVSSRGKAASGGNTGSNSGVGSSGNHDGSVSQGPTVSHASPDSHAMASSYGSPGAHGSKAGSKGALGSHGPAGSHVVSASHGSAGRKGGFRSHGFEGVSGPHGQIGSNTGLGSYGSHGSFGAHGPTNNRGATSPHASTGSNSGMRSPGNQNIGSSGPQVSIGIHSNLGSVEPMVGNSLLGAHGNRGVLGSRASVGSQGGSDTHVLASDYGGPGSFRLKSSGVSHQNGQSGSNGRRGQYYVPRIFIDDSQSRHAHNTVESNKLQVSSGPYAINTISSRHSDNIGYNYEYVITRLDMPAESRHITKGNLLDILRSNSGKASASPSVGKTGQNKVQPLVNERQAKVSKQSVTAKVDAARTPGQSAYSQRLPPKAQLQQEGNQNSQFMVIPGGHNMKHVVLDSETGQKLAEITNRNGKSEVVIPRGSQSKQIVFGISGGNNIAEISGGQRNAEIVVIQDPTATPSPGSALLQSEEQSENGPENGEGPEV